VLGSNYLQSHILHFYLLAALDYVRAHRVLRSPPHGTWTFAPIRRSTGWQGICHRPSRRAAEPTRWGRFFGGRMPLPHTYVPGGFTSTPTAARIAAFRTHLTWLRSFIQTVYLPDVQTVGSGYADYFSVGSGHKNLLAYGVFDLDDAGTTKLLKSGSVQGGATTVSAFSSTAITEQVTYSWYDDASNNLPPASGATQPVYPKSNAYSWLKAPRLQNNPFEAGPLARMWVNGDYRQGISVMDRHVARALEAQKVAQAMDGWLTQLSSGASVYSAYATPASGSGVGLAEAPRGALGHWVQISGGKVARYQVITPTCWNASPRDGSGVRGPMEQALVGTPIQDPARPIEALRVIHSFDPCLSCAVHVMQPNGKAVVVRARTV